MLKFSPADGSIESITYRDSELAVKASEAFTLQLLDREGNASLLRSREFRFEKETYNAHPDFPSLQVKLNVTADATFTRFRPEVTGVPADHVLEWIDAPQVHCPGGLKLFQPHQEGLIITTPGAKKEYWPIGFADREKPQSSFFPGWSHMQFMAVYNGNGGFYFAAHDPDCTTKAVDFEAFEDSVRLTFQTFTGCSYGEDYHSSFDYVIGSFDGGWMDACLIYRSWLESCAPFVPAKFPRWMENSPVILIYPVQGQGLDAGSMGPNCYYPYTNALPYLKNLSKKLDTNIMALLMHWEGTAPWAPPYVWPPYGGEENFAAFRDALHRDNNLLGVYCSGTAWTCRSCINDYAPGCTPEQEKNMMRGPKGEIDAAVCNGETLQRFGYDLCLAEPWSQKTVKDEVRKMSSAGIDYVQFFDQNLGGCTFNCYSREHHHPPVPGSWQISMMRSLMEEIRKENGNVVLGCESAAAEPYTDYLLLNDCRAPSLYCRGVPVPAQQFIFHGRSSNFSGNQAGVWWNFDLSAVPWNLLYRLAYSFNAGDILSLTLKDSGKVHWCWGLHWDEAEPDQDQVLTLVRNLNAARKKYPEFLLYGQMIKPVHNVVCGKLDLKLLDRTIEVDSVFVSSWKSADGRTATFITNFMPEEQEIVIDGKAEKLPPLDTMVINS